MKNLTSIDHLKFWISIEGFPDYNLEDQIAHGVYGLVFFLNVKHLNSHPTSIAVKTLNPDALPKDPAQLEELQREFSKWIRLPRHQNVIAAHRFKIARVPIANPTDTKQHHQVEIPVMSMERMDGTLADWIGNENISKATKLCAIAQAFNGLSHLYSNGIQGHGDLKPSNILHKDMSNTVSFSGKGFLGNSPYVIKIADFGWADAWVDYGFMNKALRQYIAPERLGIKPTVFPEKSDIFSMGIIAAELLLGRHPASNLKKAKKSDGEWIKLASRGDWNLSALSSDALRCLIKSCLDPSPHARPTAREAVQIICQEFKKLEGVDIEPTLECWNKDNIQVLMPFISEISEEIGRLDRTLGLGAEEEAKSIRRLREIQKKIKTNGIYPLKDWEQASRSLLKFIEKNESQVSQLEISKIRVEARRHFESLGGLTLEEFDSLAQGIHEKDTLPAFEHYSYLLGKLAGMAGDEFEVGLSEDGGLSPLGISGFAFYKANQSRTDFNETRIPFEYLDIAIKASPLQAVPYYFRALWRQHSLLFAKIEGYSSIDFDLHDLISDIETACQLDPNWREPRKLLDEVRQKEL